ncbi:hypothetical protein HDV00_009529, partial [Rhizophlyctis rosea]
CIRARPSVVAPPGAAVIQEALTPSAVDYIRETRLANLTATSRTLWFLHVQTAADYALTGYLGGIPKAKEVIAPFALTVSPTLTTFIRDALPSQADLASKFEGLYTEHINLIAQATDAALNGDFATADSLAAGPLKEGAKKIATLLEQIDNEYLQAAVVESILVEHETLTLDSAKKLKSGDAIGAYAGVVHNQVRTAEIADRLAKGICRAKDRE